MRTLNEFVHNCHWVIPGILARSGQPSCGAFKLLNTRNGYRSVLNLREAHPEWRWWLEEKRLCCELHIQHVDLRFCSREVPSKSLLNALIGSFDAVPRPLLIKCSGGSDRTALATALFIVSELGWEYLGFALHQFALFPYLHRPSRDQKWLRQFILYAAERTGGRRIRDWTAENYDPDDFLSWLTWSRTVSRGGC